ncbi:hypothetical protein, variant [Aphanomyces invadans]|uniref:Uncharacterized protein n=1 Tax=Aphanomyces invadans TaxID=157072 RepID=A0A024U5F4_9STRA|nr:hypothetical protein, variant [Aphanomyces invadans]ETW01132.1 hypothetical protein, variant [Aphanomyces invadans]|eukprot:XP_008870130.1 hypothetical protein, variant [Aphanomyces invadans]
MTTANKPPIVVEDVEMDETLDADDIEDVQMDAANEEVDTFLLQLKLQMDERDAAGVSFSFESFTSVLVQCFVPLLEHSSMLQIVPMIHLRIAEVDHKFLVEVLSNTHIYVPHELVTKSTSGMSTTYHLNLPILRTPLKCDFLQAVPMLVTEFIKQMHIFDPQPPPPPTPVPKPVQSPPSQRPRAIPPESTVFPLAHFPGTLYHANDINGSVVTAILLGVTPSSLYILHFGPTNHHHDLAVLHQVISLKDISRVVLKRGENKSFVVHFKTAGAPCKPIFSQSSERIVAMIQSYMEKHSAKRRLDHGGEDPRPRHVKKANGFDMSSFFANMEKATKEVPECPGGRADPSCWW